MEKNMHSAGAGGKWGATAGQSRWRGQVKQTEESEVGLGREERRR